MFSKHCRSTELRAEAPVSAVEETPVSRGQWNELLRDFCLRDVEHDVMMMMMMMTGA